MSAPVNDGGMLYRCRVGAQHGGNSLYLSEACFNSEPAGYNKYLAKPTRQDGARVAAALWGNHLGTRKGTGTKGA